jgi:hypothetical protein
MVMMMAHMTMVVVVTVLMMMVAMVRMMMMAMVTVRMAARAEFTVGRRWRSVVCDWLATAIGRVSSAPRGS